MDDDEMTSQLGWMMMRQSALFAMVSAGLEFWLLPLCQPPPLSRVVCPAHQILSEMLGHRVLKPTFGNVFPSQVYFLPKGVCSVLRVVIDLSCLNCLRKLFQFCTLLFVHIHLLLCLGGCLAHPHLCPVPSTC